MTIVILAALLAAAPADQPAGDDNDRKVLRESLAAAITPDVGRQGVELPAGSSEAVRRWVKANGRAMHGIGPSGLREQPWGLTAASTPGVATDKGPPRIYLYVFDRHAAGKLVVYGLTGGVAKATLLSDREEAPLPTSVVGKSLVITMPKENPDPLATVVMLHLDRKLEVTDLAARPDDAGRFVLHARDAVVHGRTLRYEPEPHKDTLGYWTNPADWAAWEFEVAAPGTYDVTILQGCGKGSGGSVVNFAVGEQSLKVTVQDTGGFQNFVSRDIGRVRLDKAGRYPLTVKPADKPGVAVMDLRSVTLTPVK